MKQQLSAEQSGHSTPCTGHRVPGIETTSDAKRVVRTAQFPPVGERGVAGTVRANAYGEDFGEYVTDANDETLVVIQLESRAAVERADEILGVDGIDVVFIGENDLSAAFGSQVRRIAPRSKRQSTGSSTPLRTMTSIRGLQVGRQRS